MGVDARIAELPRTSKLKAPAEEYPPSDYSVLPKVVAKFKPPVRVAPLAAFASSSKALEDDGTADSQTPSVKQTGISAASFYGSKKQQQLWVFVRLSQPKLP